MAKFGRGLICLTLTASAASGCSCRRWPPATAPSTARRSPCPSRRQGVTTGISAADRARTVQAAVARDAKADDLVHPGTSSRCRRKMAAC
jgi:3,4-dihydroxy 2-butanone 4-phosphate synthase/GTP cyclohydrolase II